MTDLVERLREIAYDPEPLTLAREAADEIERLRKTIDDMETEQHEINNWKQREIERLRTEIERLEVENERLLAEFG